MSGSKSKEYVFKFKQFVISHCDSAMKVGTDGVLLGAWAPTENAHTVWDIGCGSGLISLMIAQRCNAIITGIEIDPIAALESNLNVSKSPWKNRITIIVGDATKIHNPVLSPDLIVSNPPFFTEPLKSPIPGRGTARHESSLGLESLISLAAENLSESGRVCFISPTDRADDVEWSATFYGLHITRRTDIRTKATKDPSRTLWELSKISNPCMTEVNSIRDESGSYSKWYRGLTAEFYTHLK